MRYPSNGLGKANGRRALPVGSRWGRRSSGFGVKQTCILIQTPLGITLQLWKAGSDLPSLSLSFYTCTQGQAATQSHVVDECVCETVSLVYQFMHGALNKSLSSNNGWKQILTEVSKSLVNKLDCVSVKHDAQSQPRGWYKALFIIALIPSTFMTVEEFQGLDQ